MDSGTLPTVARDWALFLDVDGTLLDFVPRPEDAVVPPPLLRTIGALSAALDGAVALVSGRKIADLDRLFAPLRLPVAGQHGAEARRGECVFVLAPDTSMLAAILAPVHALGKRPTIMIENKGLSAAVHYAGSGSEHDILNALLARAVADAAGAYRLLPSHLAFDIVPGAVDKGTAVRWFMNAAPFASRVPVFIGDERTDEDGFAAVVALGGYAIKVGPRADTIAPWHIGSPQDLQRWLADALATLERSP